jgi:hypothetical protein
MKKCLTLIFTINAANSASTTPSEETTQNTTVEEVVYGSKGELVTTDWLINANTFQEGTVTINNEAQIYEH